MTERGVSEFGMPMRGNFDLHALHEALDAERRARGLGWAAVAREIGVSASTLSGLRARRAAEGDGVLGMLVWIRRTPESFVRGGATNDEASAALPIATTGVLRFDARAIHRALETRRTERGMTWNEVAAAIGGINAAGLQRLRSGGRVGFPQIMRVFAWLGEPAARFVQIAPR